MTRLNNPESCICCARRADGLAVGRPGRLGWFCAECGPELAKAALQMAEQRKLDPFEERACVAVAELCGTSTVTLSATELPDFIAWAVCEFGPAIRKEVEGGKPPF